MQVLYFNLTLTATPPCLPQAGVKNAQIRQILIFRCQSCINEQNVPTFKRANVQTFQRSNVLTC